MNAAIDLSRFTNPDDAREIAKAPHAFLGGAVATDNAIAIWCEAPGADFSPTDMPPKFEEILADAKSVAENSDGWVCASAVGVADQPCETCKGTLQIAGTDECEECSGEGEFFHGRHSYLCSECDGAGEIENSEKPQSQCPACRGMGIERYRPSEIKDGNKAIDSRYVRLIATLPNAEIQTTMMPNEAWTFRFDGGYGVVMGMRI